LVITWQQKLWSVQTMLLLNSGSAMHDLNKNNNC